MISIIGNIHAVSQKNWSWWSLDTVNCFWCLGSHRFLQVVWTSACVLVAYSICNMTDSSTASILSYNAMGQILYVLVERNDRSLFNDFFIDRALLGTWTQASTVRLSKFQCYSIMSASFPCSKSVCIHVRQQYMVYGLFWLWVINGLRVSWWGLLLNERWWDFVSSLPRLLPNAIPQTAAYCDSVPSYLTRCSGSCVSGNHWQHQGSAKSLCQSAQRSSQSIATRRAAAGLQQIIARQSRIRSEEIQRPSNCQQLFARKYRAFARVRSIDWIFPRLTE